MPRLELPRRLDGASLCNCKTISMNSYRSSELISFLSDPSLLSPVCVSELLEFASFFSSSPLFFRCPLPRYPHVSAFSTALIIGILFASISFFATDWWPKHAYLSFILHFLMKALNSFLFTLKRHISQCRNNEI